MPIARQPSVHSLDSRAFIGLPWPRKMAGIGCFRASIASPNRPNFAVPILIRRGSGKSTGRIYVDDDLAGELVGVLADGVLDARVVDGEDHDLAAERRSGRQRGGPAAELVGE